MTGRKSTIKTLKIKRTTSRAQLQARKARQNLPDEVMDKFAKQMEEETNEKIRKLLGVETNEPVEGGIARDLDETPPKTDGDTSIRKAKGELIPFGRGHHF